MAVTKVVFKVAAPAAEGVYICGSSKNLGAWDAAKAVKLELCSECGMYTTTKMIEAGSTVEFKVLGSKSWDHVEKYEGGWDVQNHSFVAEKGLVVEVEVKCFA